MSKSLLELESARKRLEELEQERITFLELIKKLKGIKDTIEPLSYRLKQIVAEGEDKKKEIEHLISSTKNTLINIEKLSENLINGFQSRTDAKIKDINGIFDEIVSEYNELEELKDKQIESFESFLKLSNQKLEDAISKILDEINKSKSEQINKIQDNFNKLRDEQIEKLDHVSKAYEHMRTSYDAMKNMVDSNELSINTLRKDLESNYISIKTILDKVDVSIDEIQKGLYLLQRETENKTSILKQEIENKMTKNEEKLNALIEQKEITLLAKLKKQKTFAFVMFIMIVISIIFVLYLKV